MENEHLKNDYAFYKISLDESKLAEFNKEFDDLMNVIDNEDYVTHVNIANYLLKAGFDVDNIMKFINDLIDGFGVERIKSDYYQVDNYWYYTIALFVNKGDTYDETIVFNTEDNEFSNESWGSWYEEFLSTHPNEVDENE
jgi:hypothetical protein